MNILHPLIIAEHDAEKAEQDARESNSAYTFLASRDQSTAGVGNVFAITGRINGGLSLAGRNIN